MRQDETYNQRQYERMLQTIEAYEKGSITLGRLAINLEGLIQALENISNEQRHILLTHWGTLEDVHSIALDRSTMQRHEEDDRLITAALTALKAELKHMVDLAS
jgi:hypothetical protein